MALYSSTCQDGQEETPPTSESVSVSLQRSEDALLRVESEVFRVNLAQQSGTRGGKDWKTPNCQFILKKL